jgi:pimeloyl-ACP methyl ester carboxylesterase
VLDRLARADRRAIALDLPGFGTASQLRPDEPVLEQYDAFAAAAVEHVAQEAGPAIVGGNSLGGCIALRVGQRCGELPIAGIVPVAPAGLDMPRWFSAIERDPIVRTLLAIPAPLPEVVVREVVGRAYRTLGFHRGAEVDGSVIEAFTSHHRDRSTVRRYLDTGRRLLPELNDATCFDLARIRCPVRLVWGERDRMVSPRGAQRVAEALPDTEVVLLADVGHCPQVETPERIVDLLCEFPARLARAA